MRPILNHERNINKVGFPFLLGGTFIEALWTRCVRALRPQRFPFLLGGTFIEAGAGEARTWIPYDISLPFGRDFH